MKKMKLIGLTGQTGAGKSTVCDVLQRMGYVIIDADRISHEVTETNVQCIGDLVTKFSCLILNDDGTLNRKRLGSIVFSDKKNLVTLNKTIFPYIIDEIERRLAQMKDENPGVRYVVLDAPTLFESGMDKRCDIVVAVLAERETRMQRILSRDRIRRQEAEKRIRSQQDEEYFRSQAAFTIRNDGDAKELEQQVHMVFEQVRAALER